MRTVSASAPKRLPCLAASTNRRDVTIVFTPAAVQAARMFVEPAVKLIEQLPEGTERLRAELDVRLVEGMAVSPLYGLASTERLRTYQRVCELSERLGDISAEVQGRINVAGVYMSRGEVSRSLEIMQRCVELAQRSAGNRG